MKTRSENQSRAKGPALDAVTFHKLRERITAASGIYIAEDENSRFILERRLLPRLRVRGLTSFSDYESAIDEKEMEAVLDMVAIHETYFFREKRQLLAFSEHILPELASMSQPLRIWSAGCSTGEEAYTIAMLLSERGMLQGGHVQLIASDLSRRVVESAVRGIYGASSFRTTGTHYQKKYFHEAGRGLWAASEMLRSSVQFEQFNLIDLSERLNGKAARDRFDVIFCRNVLMYFDEYAAKKTLRAFHSLLKKGGYLLLGHAESLLPLGTAFEPVQIGRELVHRK
ncbi:MAG TPA: protein-glutamate O-methyltransferase CheR [Blastocatellia bacterium]|nr:protein-glutamate O-methyltransferase CheR [Blastocatellia bacterium]